MRSWLSCASSSCLEADSDARPASDDGGSRRVDDLRIDALVTKSLEQQLRALVLCKGSLRLVDGRDAQVPS